MNTFHLSADVVERLGWVLVHSVWQFALIALLAGAMVRALRQYAAATRYGVLVVAMSMSVAAPVVTWLLMPSDVPTHRNRVAFSVSSLPDALDRGNEATEFSSDPTLERDSRRELSMLVPGSLDHESNSWPLVLPYASAEFSAQKFLANGVPLQPSWLERVSPMIRPWLGWIVVAWCLGVVMCSARPLLSWYTVRRLRRVGVSPVPAAIATMLEQTSNRLRLRQSVQILQSTLTQVPIAVGYLRPVILLPVSVISGIPTSQLEAILAHELAHVRRHDFLINLLQTLIETLFFYHPAVWWLSHRIRIERENCCDDLAVSMLGNRVEYGRALLAIEELRGKSTLLALGARGGSLLDRVQRLFRRESAERSVGGVGIVGVGLPAIMILSLGVWASTQAEDEVQKTEQISMASEDTNAIGEPDGQPGWGEVVNGLRAKVVPVLSSMSEEAVDSARSVTAFETLEDVGLAVEIENVSDKPVSVRELRYGSIHDESSRNFAVDWFGQFLFSIDYFDADSKPIERPELSFISEKHELVGGALTSTLEPKQSIKMLLRPNSWIHALSQQPLVGKQRVVVRYRGAAEGIAGEVVTAPVEFSVKKRGYRPSGLPALQPNDEPNFDPESEPDITKQLVWGEPVNGLRAALDVIPEGRNKSLSHGTKPKLNLLVQNVSDQPVTLASFLWLSELKVTAKNAKGDDVKTTGIMYTGEPVVVRVLLKPQQVVTFDAGNVGLAVTQERAETFEHMTHRWLVAPRGEYSLQATERFGNSFRLEDGKGNVLVPLEGDFKGDLTTGAISIDVENELIECEIVDAVTGKPVEGTMANFRTIKPKTANSEETTIALMVWARNAPSRIYFTIPHVPEDIAQRPDRDELEVRFAVYNHPDYEDFLPTETIPLKQFFHEGPKAAREVLRQIKLTPKKKVADGSTAVAEPAPSASLEIKYDMPGAEADSRIFVQRMDPEFHAKHGRRDEYGHEEHGGVRSSRLKNGESLTLNDLRAGTYLVARFRLLEIVREGTGTAQKSVYLDRQWIEIADRETKSLSVSRRAGQSIAGRIVIPKDFEVNTLVVHVCNEKAGGCGTLTHRDVVLFDALNANEDGTFKTEPLPPGQYKIVVEGYANHSLAVSGIIAPSWEGTADVTVTEGSAPPDIEVTLGKLDQDAWLKDAIEAEKSCSDLAMSIDLPAGLEFLKPYPKLHGLSLDMTEARFKAIVRAGQLAAQSTLSDGGKRRYAIPTGDEHVVVVMFDNGKCSGIQRIRGENGPQKVTFDSLSVTFKNTHRTQQAEQIDIQANGNCVYYIAELPARGDIAKQPEARLTSKIDPLRMLELERLLVKTNWFKGDPSDPSAPPLHSDESQLTVVRDGVTTTVKCLAPRDESYRTLLWQLRGIATQEHFVYALDWVAGDASNRQLALIDIRFGIEALEERPGRGLPFFDFDYRRLLPTFSRMLRNPSQAEDEVLTAIKVATFVRSADDHEFIARLKHDRNPNVRNTVAMAISDFGGERAIPILIEMVSSSEEARWGLIRLGDIAVPAIVKLIEAGSSANDIVSEQMVRSYLDHRKELSGPIDGRVIAAARQALEKTSERSQRTQYFKEFLQLTEEIAEAKVKVEAVDTGTRKGLEFLKQYPKLHGLSLDMTEPQFQEIVTQQEWETRKTSEGGKVTHQLSLGDGHTLIVMFNEDGNCRGIQRVRGEEENPPEVRMLIQLDPPPVVGDFSKVNDPEELLDSLAKSQLASLIPQTGGGFFHQPGTPPQAMFVAIWESQYAADENLDPRIQRLIELGERALPSVHQRLNGLKATDLMAAHLTLVLRSAGTTESVPVLVKLLKTIPSIEPDGTQSLESSVRGVQGSVTQIAVTSALWKLTGRKHVLTADQCEKWWQSVESDFVVPRERETPEFVLRITPQRINDLVKGLSTNEVAAREKLIVIGPLALPHLMMALQAELEQRPDKGEFQPGEARSQARRIAWVMDELGATDKLPTALRRNYFAQRFGEGMSYGGYAPIEEQAVCRALSYCSFADFCTICVHAERASEEPQVWRLRGWMHLNSQVFSRRFSNTPTFVSGDPSGMPHWKDVIPAADAETEIAGAVPVIVAALSDKERLVRSCAAKLADIIGLCSSERPEPLIVALRDAWLSEADANLRLDIGLAMARFSTPLVLQTFSDGLRSERLDIVSDSAALMDWVDIEFSDETRADFQRLVELTRHEDDKLRYRATRSLGGKAPQLLAPELERLGADRFDDTRQAVAVSLRSDPDPKFADVLFKLADDPNVQIRIEALSSLANLKHPESMPRFVPFLRDEKVHGYAVAALASMGGKDSLSLMMSELEAGNDVGGMIYQHLRRLTGEQFEEKPELWLNWWHKHRPTTDEQAAGEAAAER
ncbi:MAG: M56 family metallopeptidase [Verrucomicrobiales bacterium]